MSVAELVEFNDDGEARVECVCTAGFTNSCNALNQVFEINVAKCDM